MSRAASGAPPGPSPGRRPARILVIRRKALGDALVSLPAVLRLREAFPEAEVDLVVDRGFAPLFAGLDPRLRILAWPPAGGGPLAWVRELRARRYDLVLDHLGSPRTAFWTAASGAPLRVGYDLRWRRLAYNLLVPRNRQAGRAVAAFAGEAFLDPLRALGLAPPPWRPAALAPPPEASLGRDYLGWRDRWRRSRPRPRAGLILSASWSAKAWPAREAARLCGLLEAAGIRPLLIMGPQDADLEERLRREAPAADFAPPTDLLELSDLLVRLDLLVATDTGARHLAATLGVPTVTLYGPTDPRGWNPVGPDHVAVRTGEPCSPCNLTICPVPGHPCLDGLSAETVLGAAATLLGRRRPRIP